MSRKTSIPYKEIIPKYQTRYYSISKLAKEYNISKSTLCKYIKQNNIRINEQAQYATNALNNGFLALEKIINERDLKINERPKETQNKGLIDTQNNDLTECKNINTLIVSEVINIVKQKNPYFAYIFQNLSDKVLKISNDLLDNGITNTKDLKNITSAMKDINDTLQVIPKPPAFAQQININNNKEFVKHIEVEIVSK
ncbi:helix-turn-helix domain-containing protein [Helicobacter bilis]|uniref:helix-turn-helix domain-containing protein n=1 Tax=Helicobacter bilis TaxID=37372 RepID=UPI000CF14571|nr:helix-turn-helix domain-containing protein [Helicobacter bilis]